MSINIRKCDDPVLVECLRLGFEVTFIDVMMRAEYTEMSSEEIVGEGEGTERRKVVASC